MEISIILWAIGLFIAGGICGMCTACICIIGGMADARKDTDCNVSDEDDGTGSGDSE